jgi:hypothetical protein
MLSIILTGYFSNPLISTGTHFTNFFLEMHGFKENQKVEA